MDIPYMHLHDCRENFPIFSQIFVDFSQQFRNPNDEITILTEPGGLAFSQSLGIGKYNDWWIVYGYRDVCPKEALLNYFKKNKYTREISLFNRIVKKKQSV